MKIVANFFIVWGLVMLGVIAFRTMTNKERWTLFKTVAFSAGCAILALVVLTTIVIIF